MARYENRGILDTYVPETLEELFHHADIGGNPNFAAEITNCAARAWIVFDVTSHLTKPRAELQNLLTEICAREDLLNGSVKRDARDLLVAEEVLRHALKLYERDLKRVALRNTAERRMRALRYFGERFGTAMSLAMKIIDLDKRIAVRPHEPTVLAGRKNLGSLQKGRDSNTLRAEKKLDPLKQFLRRLIDDHPHQKDHWIAKKALKKAPANLPRRSLRMLQDYVKQIRQQPAVPQPPLK